MCFSVLRCIAVACSGLFGHTERYVHTSMHIWLLLVVALCGYGCKCAGAGVCRVAVCCSVLQCVAVCCSVLQCALVCCSVLQVRRCGCMHTYIYATPAHLHATLQHPATHCNTLQHTATHCNTLQHADVLVLSGNNANLCGLQLSPLPEGA